MSTSIGPPSTISSAPLGRSPKKPEQLAIRIGRPGAAVTSVALGDERDEQVAGVDPIADGEAHLGHRRVARGDDLVFHLHRLDDHQHLAVDHRSPAATWTAITVPGSGQIGPPPAASASWIDERGPA